MDYFPKTKALIDTLKENKRPSIEKRIAVIEAAIADLAILNSEVSTND
jgi:hypothetical protein